MTFEVDANAGVTCKQGLKRRNDLLSAHLRPIHTERKVPLMFVVLSLIVFAFALAFVRCEHVFTMLSVFYLEFEGAA